MTDAKYFTTTKKGEIFELKNELNSDKKEKKREAVKKVIASMTVGKDVSALFPDVVNCMQTDNVELKKLVYLYLMNYAKSQPELAIMAVNTFVKDCEDPNPLIRALAVRTMGCIRVDKITEYLCEPLRKCMKDEDPYVRKTAAICVAKLHDINAQMVVDQGFVEMLTDLLSDANPMVVANAVAAITEINESHTLIEINAQTVNKLLTALIQDLLMQMQDIFRKYPNRYEGIISTLCENLDTLDEPEARASMIWIVGEYAERIDNADELLESFVDGFHDENTQVQLQLLTAVVKLFLKRPNDTQQLVQKVLTLATQDSDNPDLRDRGYIYWRLLSADPQAAKEVVLAEKPLISEETDLLEPSLLNQLVCHIGSLASVYHRPPSSFIDPIRHPVKTASLPGSTQQEQQIVSPAENVQKQPTVIQPPQDSIIADLLSLDLSVPSAPATQQPSTSALISDIFGSPQPVAPPIAQPALASIFDTPPPPPAAVPTSTSIFDTTSPSIFAPPSAPTSSPLDLLGSGIGGTLPTQPPQQLSSDIFGLSFGGSSAGDLTSLMGVGTTQSSNIWLDASKSKGLQLEGRWLRRNGQIVAEMNLTNRALQPLDGFAIQFNSNSFGLIPLSQFNPGTIFPNQTISTTLNCSTNGPVQKMEPLSNLQVAIKNNIDVFYFAVVLPLNVYFDESGQMDKRDFLQLWKDIPEQNEIQFTIQNTKGLSADDICSVLQQNNVFTVARRTVDGQELLYHSIKYTNQ
uniref:AP complex subunit beta n=1 Tax=Meloidogyne javanica TaxID=6303 RepID=A0A915MEC3_MELJA